MIQLKKRFITDTPFPYLPCSYRILGIAIHTRADVDPVQIGDDLGRHIIIAHSLNYPFVKKMCFALFGALLVLAEVISPNAFGISSLFGIFSPFICAFITGDPPII